MNNKHLATLLTLLGLLALNVEAASPWDRKQDNQTPAVQAEAPADMAEPIEAQPIAAEPVAFEPAAVEPIAIEPEPAIETTTAEPVVIEPIEPVAIENSADAPVASETAAPIEVTETSGDVLAMPTTATETASVLMLDFPRRGMDQEKVQSELGAPAEIKSAIGQPPITRWIYNDRVVYFEHSTVLHVVAR